MATYYFIEENILRNATREEFARYEKALRICRQKSYKLVVFKSFQNVQNNNNNNNQKPGEDFFEKFLKSNKQRVGFLSIVDSLQDAWLRVPRGVGVSSSVTVVQEKVDSLEPPPEQKVFGKLKNSANNLFNKLSATMLPQPSIPENARRETPVGGTVDKDKNQFVKDLIDVGYKDLREMLECINHPKDTLFENNAFILDEFIALERSFIQNGQVSSQFISIIELIIKCNSQKRPLPFLKQ